MPFPEICDVMSGSLLDNESGLPVPLVVATCGRPAVAVLVPVDHSWTGASLCEAHLAGARNYLIRQGEEKNWRIEDKLQYVFNNLAGTTKGA